MKPKIITTIFIIIIMLALVLAGVVVFSNQFN